jgi:hypothetical protein
VPCLPYLRYATDTYIHRHTHTYFPPAKNNISRNWNTIYKLCKVVIREKYMRTCVKYIYIDLEFCDQYAPPVPESCRRIRQPSDEITNGICWNKPTKSRFAFTGPNAEPWYDSRNRVSDSKWSVSINPSQGSTILRKSKATKQKQRPDIRKCAKANSLHYRMPEEEWPHFKNVYCETQ